MQHISQTDQQMCVCMANRWLLRLMSAAERGTGSGRAILARVAILSLAAALFTPVSKMLESEQETLVEVT